MKNFEKVENINFLDENNIEYPKKEGLQKAYGLKEDVGLGTTGPGQRGWALRLDKKLFIKNKFIKDAFYAAGDEINNNVDYMALLNLIQKKKKEAETQRDELELKTFKVLKKTNGWGIEDMMLDNVGKQQEQMKAYIQRHISGLTAAGIAKKQKEEKKKDRYFIK